ncbi:MAG TPA: hypothetical protein VNA65_02785 [Candidatus Dormibacteraeota bacterium]|nr:hypothetical protein [Candidatus Dormibacteraeota bacterium]
MAARIKAALDANGLAPHPITLAGADAFVGQTAEFRWTWMATRLHTYVFVTTFEELIATPRNLDGFLDAARNYALLHKPGLRPGNQTGTASIAVAVVDDALEEAVDWASSPHGRRSGQITFPVVADIYNRRVTYPRAMALGIIYVPHLKQMVRRYVEAPMRESQ